jgi:hypothetical protein
VAAVALTLAGCATARVQQGVFRAPALYRVTLPGPAWEVASADDTRIALHHRESQAGILASAECGEPSARRDLPLLARQIFIGLRERETLENGLATVGGVEAAHAIVEAGVNARGERMRMEAYVLKDERCVYDLVYVATPETFEAQRPDFKRFVDSFAKE